MDRARVLDEVHPSFVADLEQSIPFVWRAAHWLTRTWGLKVTIAPTLVRPDTPQRQDYLDEGDLEIVQRVEVKHRPDLLFTCAMDYGYPSLIVDTVHKWDRAHPKAWAYIIINGPGSHCAVIRRDTAPRWHKQELTDKRTGLKDLFYLCPVECATFHRMGDTP